ncbi:MAG TPA: phospholipase [Planctomycetaceae bacterium]|nr:phospholipase [Planctomycetaceae bacterium]
MAITAALIQRLHRINRQKADLNSQLLRGPKAVAAARTKLQAAEDQLQAERDALKQSRVDADSKQLQMKERENKIHDLNGKLNAAKENREYQALKDQIAADTQANLVLSDEILEILESIDAQELAIKETEVAVAKVEEEFQAIERRIGEKRVGLESELERVGAELAEAEKELSGDFKREYDRLVPLKGEDAMAELEGNCCGGCYQTLTPQLLDKTKIGQPIICPSCGRILYQAT